MIYGPFEGSRPFIEMVTIIMNLLIQVLVNMFCHFRLKHIKIGHGWQN